MTNLVILCGKSSNSNNIINIEVDMSTCVNVDYLKIYIAKELNITKDDLIIVIEGKHLENNVYLKDTNILNKFCFHYIEIKK